MKTFVNTIGYAFAAIAGMCFIKGLALISGRGDNAYSI